MTSQSGSVTTTTTYDPATGERTVTGGSFVIGDASTLPVVNSGTWTLVDDYARRCTLELTRDPLGAGGVYKANQTGFCSMGMDVVKGWSSAGSAVVLTDQNGMRVAALLPDSSGDMQGRLETGMLSGTSIKMRRGEF